MSPRPTPKSEMARNIQTSSWAPVKAVTIPAAAIEIVVPSTKASPLASCPLHVISVIPVEALDGIVTTVENDPLPSVVALPSVPSPLSEIVTVDLSSQ